MSFYTVNSLAFSYTSGNRLLNNINFKLNKDQCIGIIGPNGCGKTTLVKLLLGILKPDSGEIYLQNKNIRYMSLSDIGKKVGFVYQNPEKQLFCSTVWDQMQFSFKFNSKASNIQINDNIKYYLDKFDLFSKKDSSPFVLSRGEKQRLALASVLSRDVEFLMLDEPTSSLDVLRVKQLEKYLMKIRDEKKGYLIISHDEKFLAKHVDNILSFKNEGVEIL